MLVIRDALYVARRWVRDAVIDHYSAPLRDRVAVLERDNHELHMALAADVKQARDEDAAAVIEAARDVATCREDADHTGPCGACLERLDAAIDRWDDGNQFIRPRSWADRAVGMLRELAPIASSLNFHPTLRTKVTDFVREYDDARAHGERTRIFQVYVGNGCWDTISNDAGPLVNEDNSLSFKGADGRMRREPPNNWRATPLGWKPAVRP